MSAMLRSLYAYKGSHDRTLAFAINEKFLEVGQSKDAAWVHVINDRGHLGYVPKNYVALDQIPPDEMIQFLDICLKSLQVKSEKLTKLEKDAVVSLIDSRQEWQAKLPQPQIKANKIKASYENDKITSFIDSSNEDRKVENQKTVVTKLSNGVSLQHHTQNSLNIKAPSANFKPEVPSKHSNIKMNSPSANQKRRAPSPPQELDTFNDTSNCSSVFKAENRLNVELDTNVRRNSLENEIFPNLKRNQENFVDLNSLKIKISSDFYRTLVDKIRVNTSASFSNSRQSVNLILESLSVSLPPLKSIFTEILNQRTERSLSDTDRFSSSDGRRLVEVFEAIRKVKDDCQQRSWALHEDEKYILGLLHELLDILNNGESSVCRSFLLVDDHTPVLTIVQYYQMETRWNLRQTILQIITVICHLSKENITFLSSSVLPLELTRQILDLKTTPEELKYILLVLGMILSLGDTLPVQNFNIMNENFVKFLLEGVEKFGGLDENHLGELHLMVLLAFNLQFSVSWQREKTHSDNLIMNVLSNRSETKYILEKLLVLFNREEDPVLLFEHTPRPPNSVIAMLTDLYQNEKTARFLYTNDEKVLCDIVVRQIKDLPADDAARKDYLRLLEGIVHYGQFMEHKHRVAEIQELMRKIEAQHESDSSDRKLSKSISEKIR